MPVGIPPDLDPQPIWWKLVLGVALAGAVGTLARFGLAKVFGDHLGTLLANTLGCLLFGLILAWVEAKLHANHTLRVVLLTGFMGAFTTFSTYAYLSTHLLREGQWFSAAGHILAHNILGIALFMVGLALGGRLVA